MNANLCGNGYLSPAGGFPFRLTPQADGFLQGVLPKGTTQVNAVLAMEAGSCNAHLAIYATPTTTQPLGSDGALALQVDLTGIRTQAQTLTLNVPTTGIPATYVVRLWIDSVTGTIPGKTAPAGAIVSSFTVS